MDSPGPKPSRGLQTKRRGSVLIITLVIIMSLAGLTMDLSDESGISLTFCSISRDVYLARQAARAGVQAALDRLFLDPDKEVDSLEEEWALFGPVPLPEALPEGMAVSGRISDESGKLNLNTLLDSKGGIDERGKARLTRLFRALEVGEQKADPILDWLDRDEIERMDGAESYYYQGLEEPHVCANGPFLTTSQIMLVKGIAEAFSGRDLQDYVTIHSDGKININTASAEVLQTLSEQFDQNVAEAVVAHRKTSVFHRPEDLKRVPGVNDGLYSGVSGWVTVRSSAFSIEMESSCSGVSAAVRAVAARERDKMKILYWRAQ